jgi:hypothetical protein
MLDVYLCGLELYPLMPTTLDVKRASARVHYSTKSHRVDHGRPLYHLQETLGRKLQQAVQGTPKGVPMAVLGR